MIYGNEEFDGHEFVHFVNDTASGLRAIIAVHDTTMGIGFGGCRAYAYATEQDALRDVLRLSRGMTFKNAAAGVPYGGGKSVIIANPGETPTVEQRHAFARAVNVLGGLYLTAEDVGTSTADVAVMSEVTSHVRNLPLDDAGRPAPFTARGVFAGLKAGWSFAKGGDLSGAVVAVEGLGAVGMYLCGLLSNAGASLIVCDTEATKVEEAKAKFGAKSVPVGTIHAVEADIYAPCALGGTLSKDTISELKAKLVAGGANNQLATPKDGQRLKDKGIVYCPDFVTNAGGVLSVAPQGEAFDPEAAFTRADSIEGRMAQVLNSAEKWGIPAQNAAERMARELIDAAKAKKAATV